MGREGESWYRQALSCAFWAIQQGGTPAGVDGLAAGLRNFPCLPQGQWGAIRARILSRLLCEHEKEAARAHKVSRAFEAPTAKSQMSPGLTPRSASHSHLDLGSGQIGGCYSCVICPPSVTRPSLPESTRFRVFTPAISSRTCFPSSLLLWAHPLTPLSGRLCPLPLYTVWIIRGDSRR